MTDENRLAYETVTFFEGWMLRNLREPTCNNSLKARNAAEDLINEDPEYWNRNTCERIYEEACRIAKVQPWVIG